MSNKNLADLRATLRYRPKAKRARYTGPMSVKGNMMARARGTRRPEIKFVDITTTATNFRVTGTPPVAQPLNAISQGTGAYNRIGQKILMKSLRVRGVVTNIATATQQTARVIIVYDRQCNTALPIWSDLILAVDKAATGTSNVLDGVNMGNRDRFIVLADEQMWLPAVTNTAGVLTNVGTLNSTDKNPTMFNFDRFIRLKDLEAHFNNVNGGTFADIQTGGMFMFLASGADAQYSMAWSARLRYEDV